jgi:hypothetical protein
VNGNGSSGRATSDEEEDPIASTPPIRGIASARARSGIPQLVRGCGGPRSQLRHCEMAEWRRDSALRRQGVVCDSNGMGLELGSREALGSEEWVKMTVAGRSLSPGVAGL